MAMQKWYGPIPKSGMRLVTEAESEQEARENIQKEHKNAKSDWFLNEWAKGGAVLLSETSVKLQVLYKQRNHFLTELSNVNNEILDLGGELFDSGII